MPRVLILYGTTDGHTAKIASAMADALRAEGSAVETRDAGHLAGDVRPEEYDEVIVAASIHAQGYQRAVTRWVRRHAAALNERPTAFISVCLAVLEDRPEVREDLRRIKERFFARTGWHPMLSEHVAGALPYSRYGWVKKWIIKRIVAKAGGDTDTTRDYEYTDWDALRGFVRAFAARGEVALADRMT